MGSRTELWLTGSFWRLAKNYERKLIILKLSFIFLWLFYYYIIYVIDLLIKKRFWRLFSLRIKAKSFNINVRVYSSFLKYLLNSYIPVKTSQWSKIYMLELFLSIFFFLSLIRVLFFFNKNEDVRRREMADLYTRIGYAISFFSFLITRIFSPPVIVIILLFVFGVSAFLLSLLVQLKQKRSRISEQENR